MRLTESNTPPSMPKAGRDMVVWAQGWYSLTRDNHSSLMWQGLDPYAQVTLVDVRVTVTCSAPGPFTVVKIENDYTWPPILSLPLEVVKDLPLAELLIDPFKPTRVRFERLEGSTDAQFMVIVRGKEKVQS